MHLYKTDEPTHQHPAWSVWQSKMKNLELASPLDSKARDAAMAYFEGNDRSVAATAKRLGVGRSTVTRRLERAQRNGWVELGQAPLQAGRDTPFRVCRRRIFWTYNYWTACPTWNGDTTAPMF